MRTELVQVWKDYSLIEEQQKENNKENFMYCYNRDGYRFNDRDFR